MISRRDALIARERSIAEEEASVRKDREKLSEDARKLLDRQKELISKGSVSVIAPLPSRVDGEAPPNLSEDEMLCPNCRTVISKDALMCYACGQKLKSEELVEEETEEVPAGEDEIPCPNCKTMVSKDALMCYACGVNIKDALAKLESKVSADGQPSGFRKPQIFVKKIMKKKVV